MRSAAARCPLNVSEDRDREHDINVEPPSMIVWERVGKALALSKHLGR